ncbi:MAG TPA: hypothetical protein PLA43_06695 [Bryobacteraceae bacterium]|nr:hypothetical protein [Bryobacteraceae bacterium]HOL73326.1 hypothetical protein [Bryobacteraceae bacterium]HOQ45646.1 hypothetical protein [Bryobacteraceae bacterium]HPQ16402.1 hypothetical protein [Bryobacteraceae bacterium]HPU71628.1 hypothetical protein [Bryobacteraceae bacterium]
MLGCGPARTGGVRVDPALRLLVPHDTVLLAGINMDALRKTPWFEKASLPLLDHFEKRTGLNVREDLWQALFVSDGVHSALLARGRFAEQGLEPRIQPPGMVRTPYKGHTLIGNKESAFTFVNSTVVVAGPPEAVKFILDQRGRSQGPPEALWQAALSVPADNQIWLAATGGLTPLAKAAPPSGNLANLARIFSALESAIAGADLRNGLKAFAQGEARTEEEARSLAGGIRGLIELARLSASDPVLQEVCNAIRLEPQGRMVRLDIELSPELFDRAYTRALSFFD